MRDVFEQIKGRPHWDAQFQGLMAYERFLDAKVDIVPEGAVCVGPAGAPDILKAGEHVVFHFEGVARGDFYEGDVVIEMYSDHMYDLEPVCAFALHRVEHSWGEAFYHLRATVRGENVTVLHDVRSDGRFHDFLVAHHERRAAEIFRHLWRLKPSLFLFDDVDEKVVDRIYA